jgi:hypothetical protein
MRGPVQSRDRPGNRERFIANPGRLCPRRLRGILNKLQPCLLITNKPGWRWNQSL